VQVPALGAHHAADLRRHGDPTCGREWLGDLLVGELQAGPLVDLLSDKSFLAKNSGIVTAIKGPDGTEPSQFGELTSFAITKDTNKDAAKKFVEFMMNDGYVDWLALAPEGKFPVRTRTKRPAEHVHRRLEPPQGRD
jgi:hypothetical protein